MKRALALGACWSIATGAVAQVNLGEIEVKAVAEPKVTWKEVEQTRILTGKKNKTTRTDLHPPVQTDNLRQFFSQNPGIMTPEQSTEPWTALSVRGIGDPHEAQNVLILQDGLPVPIDMYGQSGQYYAPPAPLMEEIEVVSGGAALMYGPQPGGAINFRSHRLSEQEQFGGKLGLSFGSYNLLSTVNSVKGKQGNTAYHAGYYRKQGDGYQRDNADFFAHHLQAKTHTYLENGSIVKLALQGYDSDFGMPGGMTRDCGVANANCWTGDGENRSATREFDRMKIARALLSVGLDQKLDETTRVETTVWATTNKRYSSTQNGGGFGTRPTGTTSANRQVDSHNLNLESRLRHDWKLAENENTFTMGVLSYNSELLGTNWTGQAPDSIRGDVSGRINSQTRALALFAENRFSFGRLAIVPGVRYENISLASENRFTEASRAETFNVILGGLGASYDLPKGSQLYANASQGFKPISFGTVLQQADPLVTVQGDIKPSYIYNYEAGWRGDTATWNWDVSAYWIQYQNQLATSGNTIFNGRSAHYRGVEAGLTRKDVLRLASHSLDLYANMNYLEAEYRGGELKGKVPGHAPRKTVKYGTIFRHGEKWRMSLLGTFVSDYFANDTHTSAFYVPSYNLFDLLAEVRLGQRWSVNGAVNNLLDKTYYSRVMASGILPTMGRNMYLGANYRF